MAVTYQQGELVRISAVFSTSSGTAGDPDVVHLSYGADATGITTIYTYGTDAELVKESTGHYYVDVDTAPVSGRYSWNFYSTGSGQASKQGSFYVHLSIVDLEQLMAIDSSLITFIQAGTGAVTRSVRDKLRERISVKDFGAVGDGSTDDTSAIQAAFNSTSGESAVYIPHGTYRVTDTITIGNHRTNIYGDGQHASIISFQPTTTNKVCFLFYYSGSGAFVQGSLKGVGFGATGNTQAGKVALRIIDAEEIIVDDIAVFDWSSSSKDCIGLQTRGRQTNTFSNYVIVADIPISIEDNPDNSIDIDHYHFWNGYLIADLTQPCVQIAGGVNLSHVTFDGYQSWVQGKHGLYWVDTTTSIVGISLNIHNVRWEQATDATGYFIRIEHNTGLNQLSVTNCYGGIDSNWIYLRNVDNVRLQSLYYPGTRVALDANTSVQELTFDNVRFNTAASTVTLTAKSISGTYFKGDGGTAFTFLPGAHTSGVVVQSLNPSATLGFNQFDLAAISVNSATVTKLGSNALFGVLVINALTTGVAAIYSVAGSFNVTQVMSFSDVGWWGAAAAAANYNIYSSGGEYKIQNNTGTAATFKIHFFGTGEY